MNRAGLLRNAVYLAPAVRIFGRPVLLSTVGAAVGGDKETAPVLRRALGGIPVRPWGCRCVGGGVCYETVQRKDRGELGAAALRTGASLAFPGARCARRRSGNLVRSRMPRGASAAAHEAALRRMRQAGVRWTSVAQVACELQCDRSRRRPTPGSVAFFFRDAGISPNRGNLGRARCGATGRSGPKRGCRRVSCALRWEGVRMAVRMKRDCPRFAGQPLFVRIPRLLAARAPFSAKPFFGP